MPQRQPSVFSRYFSRMFDAYLRYSPVQRGKWRLRRWCSRWLVGRLETGPWIRVSGVAGLEWRVLRGDDANETNTAAAFLDLIEPGHTMIDVGANVGYYTLTAADRIGPTGRVIAFEPDQRVAARLAENVALNGFSNVTVVAAAVGINIGPLRFNRAEDSEASSLYDVSSQPRTSIEVRGTTLDSSLAEWGISSADVLKIDAEGAEVDVLRGARRLLTGQGAPVILVEANPVTLRAAASSVEALRSTLEGLGYTISVVEEISWRGERVATWLARKD